MLQIVENEEKGPGQKIESEMAAHLAVIVETIHVQRDEGNGYWRRFMQDLATTAVRGVAGTAAAAAAARARFFPYTQTAWQRRKKLQEDLVEAGVIEASELQIA